MPTFRLIDTAAQPDTVCIETVEDDGRVTSRSYAPEDIPAEARLNLDYPEAEDRRSLAPKGQKVRWAMPDEALCSVLGIDPDELRSAAQAKGLDTTRPVKRREGLEPGEPSPR